MLAYMKSNGGIASLFINPTISDKKKKEIISKISKEVWTHQSLSCRATGSPLVD